MLVNSCHTELSPLAPRIRCEA